MNNQHAKTTLKVDDLPEIALPLHQRRLKTALISSGLAKRSGLFGFLKSMKEYFTMSKKHLAYGSAVFVFMLFVIFGGVFYHNNTPQAKAQDLVKDSITTISTMSSADLAALLKDKDFDLMDSLKEAQQAKDLTTLTPEQFAKEDTGLQIIGEIPENIKYLKYTDAAGNMVYLGLDENNIPHFKNMLMKDGSRKGYGEATIVSPDENTNLPVINPDDLPAGFVPYSGEAQVITGSAAEQK